MRRAIPTARLPVRVLMPGGGTSHQEMSLQIIPAIDLMNGACVRLEQGDPERKTTYSLAPADQARAFEADGAQRIHIVDLDGAFSGKPTNVQTIQAIRAATACHLEVGGGIRDREAVETLLTSGADHIVIGTKALEDLALLHELMRDFADQIIIGAD